MYSHQINFKKHASNLLLIFSFPQTRLISITHILALDQAFLCGTYATVKAFNGTLGILEPLKQVWLPESLCKQHKV